MKRLELSTGQKKTAETAPDQKTPRVAESSPVRIFVHDLRSRLNHIIGYSEIVLDAIEEQNRSDLVRDLVKIRKAAIRLNHLISADLRAGGTPADSAWLPLRLAANGPLNQIIGYAEMLEEETLAPELIPHRQDVQRISSSAHQFWSMVQGCDLVVPLAPLTLDSDSGSEYTAGEENDSSSGQPLGHLLVVDDEELNRDVLSRRLRREGYIVELASSGGSAMRMMREVPFDLVLLDVMMPGKDGFELLCEIRNDPQLKTLPVVMLSALNEVDRVASCIEAGADDYLTKPFNSVLLRARIGACLEKKRLRDLEMAHLHQLHSEKERLAVTLASIGDAVVTTDNTGCITLINGAAERLTGWSAAEAIGREMETVLPLQRANVDARIDDLVAQVLELGDSIELANNIELLNRAGQRIPVALHAAPMRAESGGIRGIVLVVEDITEREQFAQEMLRASKLESLSILAGGIAHEYNNILTAIFGNLSLAQLDLENLPPMVASRLQSAEQAAGRAKALTRQLLTFARGGDPIRKPIHLQEVIRSAAEFAVRDPKVRSQFHLPQDLPLADADADQISQVIHNLMLNAVQAMPAGGSVTVAAGGVTLEAPRGVLEPGSYICISVCDTGHGISPENIGRVFDPFFTTKARGSGLGLSAAYSIVRKHHGSIEVESAPGAGATFHVWIPALTAAPAAAGPAAVEIQSAGGRILVMDDEDQILFILKEMLAIAGYRVSTARDGVEALKLFDEGRAYGDPFDAVLMDLIIPNGMGGRETILGLRQRDATIPVIVSSGYSNDPVMSRHADFGFSGVLAKPYRMQDLYDTLARLVPRREKV